MKRPVPSNTDDPALHGEIGFAQKPVCWLGWPPRFHLWRRKR